MKHVVIVGLLIILSSCRQGQNLSGVAGNNADSTLADSLLQSSDSEWKYNSQDELNGLHWKSAKEYSDSIEKEYQALLKAMPQYKAYFDEEKKIWTEYQNMVRAVAQCEDHGSSSGMYVDDVLTQGITLREASFRSLLLHVRGKEVSFSKTTFTMEMIKDSYSAFVMSVSEDEYCENKPHYRNALRKEQSRWNMWMKTRTAISRKVDCSTRRYYDECTNILRRAKLIQLKNQNQTLGMTSQETLCCALPDGCSDKTLLEYPGFDKVWAKHCKFLDWYPKFE